MNNGVKAVFPRQTGHYLFHGSCIQGGANYPGSSENVKEMVGICDTNVPPLRRLACSHTPLRDPDPKSWSYFGENLRRFGTPPSSIQWGELRGLSNVECV
jgi:hypothetical protein